MKTKIFDPKPLTVMQKHLPGSLHIYLCNIRLGIPRSSWRPWNFIMLSFFYVIVLNIAILSVQCPEIRQSVPPASASPMGWFVNVSLLLIDTYYEMQQAWELVDNRLTTSSTVYIFFIPLQLMFKSNLFVFRGNYAVSRWPQFKVLLIVLYEILQNN